MRQVRHFLDLIDIPKPALQEMIDRSRAMKAALKRGEQKKPLAGRTLAMIFDKPSTRTRVSFEVGMRELGGEVVVLSSGDMQIGRAERDGAVEISARRIEAAGPQQGGPAAHIAG